MPNRRFCHQMRDSKIDRVSARSGREQEESPIIIFLISKGLGMLVENLNSTNLYLTSLN